MAELATQEVKLFGKWSFDDVEVRFYNETSLVVSSSRKRVYDGTANGMMPGVFFFSFFAELSRARARWKGGVATREVRVADENRTATTFLNLNDVARRGATRPTTREAQMCPRHIECFFSPGLFGASFLSIDQDSSVVACVSKTTTTL